MHLQIFPKNRQLINEGILSLFVKNTCSKLKCSKSILLPFNLFIALLTIGCLWGCGQSSLPRTTNPIKDTAAAIKSNKTDSFTVGNGVNLQPSYYNQGKVDFGWTLMQSKNKIKTVRLEIEPSSVNQAVHWIKEAHLAGYTIIATYHKAKVLGSDDPAEVQEAASWWVQNYPQLIRGLSNNGEGVIDSTALIINLMNEWGSHKMTAANYAKAYNAAITTIRTIYSGFIIVDIPGWGQETYTAYQACKTSTPHITDPKIVLSAHIYPNGYNQGRGHTLQPADLDDLQKTGYPCMIGEFGTGQGSCDWAGCVDYAKKLGWPVLAWAWNGDGGIMNMLTPAWVKEATATSFSTTPYFDTVYNKL